MKKLVDTQWKPGQLGNLNGRPDGTRQAFSAGFLRDLAEVWSEGTRQAFSLFIPANCWLLRGQLLRPCGWMQPLKSNSCTRGAVNGRRNLNSR